MNHKRRKTLAFVARKRRLHAAWLAHEARQREHRRAMESICRLLREFDFARPPRADIPPLPPFRLPTPPWSLTVVCHPSNAEAPTTRALMAQGYRRVIDMWAPVDKVYALNTDPMEAK